MKILNNSRGFALVELIIGITILTIMLTAILGVLSTSIKSQQYNFDEGANIQDIRAILPIVSDELRNATNITSPIVNNHAASIAYRLAHDTSDRTIMIGTEDNEGYVLVTDGTGMVRRLGSGRVRSIDFFYSNVPPGSMPPTKQMITIRIQVQNTARAGAPLTDLSTTVVTFNAF